MRGRWSGARLAAVAAGGMAGAALRWAVVTASPEDAFPWPVLLVNLAGSFLLGVVLAEEWTHPGARLLLHDAGGIGFCGGLTTFSTFTVEAVRLLDDGRTGLGLLYIGTSVTGTLVAIVAGAAVLRRVRALTLPLEEQP